MKATLGLLAKISIVNALKMEFALKANVLVNPVTQDNSVNLKNALMNVILEEPAEKRASANVTKAGLEKTAVKEILLMVS
jgi:hypothetical protein